MLRSRWSEHYPGVLFWCVMVVLFGAILGWGWLQSMWKRAIHHPPAMFHLA